MQSVSFDRAATYYDTTRGFAPGSAERVRDAIVAYAGLTPASRVLELGIGTGRIALPFLQAGYAYAGIDLSPAMLAVLRAKLEPAPAPVAVGDVLRLPFAAGRFQLVLAVHVLHLVADWRQLLREAGRVLARPGGRLLLAGDTGTRDEPQVGPDGLTPPALVRRVWDTILAELGESAPPGQPGIRPGDPAVAAALSDLGAQVEEVHLADVERAPLSARQVLQQFRDRVYSSDWARDPVVHAEAIARLERWLAEACPDPDTPYAGKGRFSAVSATFGMLQ